MLRKTLLSCIAFSMYMSLAVAGTDKPAAPATFTAAEIVDKNVSARGGLGAWRAVQTMSISGKLDAGGKNNTQLPFVLEMKRPRKTRFELEFQNQTAVQVYDGVNGWKLRPFLGYKKVEPYTAEEIKSASMEADLDGFLVDYAAKGTKVELEGTEQVEGHDAYRLKLTMKGDQVRHVWIDAKTFLEVKMEGIRRRMDGKLHPVANYFRDYKPVNGLMIPYTVETAVEGYKETHSMTIDSVVVNPKLEDSLFAKPQSK